jgi:hypothetical protein
MATAPHQSTSSLLRLADVQSENTRHNLCGASCSSRAVPTATVDRRPHHTRRPGPGGGVTSSAVVTADSRRSAEASALRRRVPTRRSGRPGDALPKDVRRRQSPPKSARYPNRLPSDGRKLSSRCLNESIAMKDLNITGDKDLDTIINPLLLTYIYHFNDKGKVLSHIYHALVDPS